MQSSPIAEYTCAELKCILACSCSHQEFDSMRISSNLAFVSMHTLSHQVMHSTKPRSQWNLSTAAGL